MSNGIQRPGTSEEMKSREEREKKAELEQESRRLDIEHLAKNPHFKRYIRRLMASGGMMQSVMTGNSQTFYKSGRQDFTREIWTELALHDRQVAMEILIPQAED